MRCYGFYYYLSFLLLTGQLVIVSSACSVLVRLVGFLLLLFVFFNGKYV